MCIRRSFARCTSRGCGASTVLSVSGGVARAKLRGRQRRLRRRNAERTPKLADALRPCLGLERQCAIDSR
jgi:hypothetical protein